MANTLQIKRGQKAKLPTLNQGEVAFVTDGDTIYVGDGATNHPVLMAHGGVPLSGDWDIGDGRQLLADQVQARDSDGLDLLSNGSGLHLRYDDVVGNYMAGFGRTPTYGRALEVQGKIEQVEEGDYARHNMITYHEDVPGPFFNLARARGTEASPAAIQDGDHIGSWMLIGYDGDSWVNVVELRADVAGGVTDGVIPTSLSCYTKDAGGTLASRFTIQSDGVVNFASTPTAGGDLLAKDFSSYQCRMALGFYQTLSDTNRHVVEYGNTVFDPNSDWDGANDEYVVPVTGRYQITAKVSYRWQVSTGDTITARIRVNGSVDWQTPARYTVGSGGGGHEISTSAILSLSAGDVVDIVAQDASTSGVDLDPSRTTLDIMRVA